MEGRRHNKIHSISSAFLSSGSLITAHEFRRVQALTHSPTDQVAHCARREVAMLVCNDCAHVLSDDVVSGFCQGQIGGIAWRLTKTSGSPHASPPAVARIRRKNPPPKLPRKPCHITGKAIGHFFPPRTGYLSVVNARKLKFGSLKSIDQLAHVSSTRRQRQA